MTDPTIVSITGGMVAPTEGALSEFFWEWRASQECRTVDLTILQSEQEVVLGPSLKDITTHFRTFSSMAFILHQMLMF